MDKQYVQRRLSKELINFVRIIVMGAVVATIFAQAEGRERNGRDIYFPPTPKNYPANALIYKSQDVMKLDVLGGIEASMQAFGSNAFDAIRVYQVRGLPHFVYFWRCTNVTASTLSIPSAATGNRDCYPLIYKKKSSSLDFYFDMKAHDDGNERACSLEDDCIQNIAAFDIRALRRLEKVSKQHDRNYDERILFLSLPFMLSGSVAAAETTVVRLNQTVAAAIVSRAVYSKSAAGKMLGFWILGHLGEITGSMLGMELLGSFFLEYSLEILIEAQFRTDFRGDQSPIGFPKTMFATAFVPMAASVQRYTDELSIMLNHRKNSLGGYYMLQHDRGHPHQRPEIGLFELELVPFMGHSRAERQSIKAKCAAMAKDRYCKWLEENALPGSGRVRHNDR